MKYKKSASEQRIKEKSRITKEEWREFTKTVWQIANTKDSNHPAVFPEAIPHRLIKLFSFVEETVLDPFAGIGTTGKVALKLDRKAVCVDQNKEFLKHLHNNLKLEQGDSSKIIIKNGDSRNMDFLGDGMVDLIITSPPYWNKANYGQGKNNLGNVQNYSEFIDEIYSVFKECYRVLAHGRKICIITANVNQYTNHGLLTFPLAADFSNILRNAGFVMVSEVIWSKDGTGGKWGSSGKQRPIFGSYPYPPNLLFKNVHEHILIFSKPPLKPIKGKGALIYSNIYNQA